MTRRAFVLAATLAIAAQARAQAPLPLELHWQAPAECPSGAEARAELERITRVRPGIELTPVAAHVQIERAGVGYSLRLRSSREGREGERRLGASDCKTLVRTVTLVLALAFGPGVEVVSSAADAQAGRAGVAAEGRPGMQPRPSARADAAAEQSRASSDAAPEQSLPRADAVPEPPSEEDDGAAWSPEWAVLAGGGAQLGVLPAAALSLSAGVEVSTGALSVSLRATALPGVGEQVAPAVDARFDGLAGALLACGDVARAGWSLGLCGGVRAGALRGRSNGASDDGSDTAPWYALTAGPALTWPSREPVRVRLEAAAGLSLRRPRFVIEGLGAVHQVPRLFGDLSLLLLVTP